MTSVFISYSRTDKNIAEYIGAELCNRGADVFIDYERLIGGENFIGRLGREIESRDFFVILLSPRSVVSKWVQAEAAWALRCNKPIIPVLIEAASLTDFFFLIPLEQIDFTRWSEDGKVDAAVQKLATALRLPTKLTRTQPVPELIAQPPSVEESNQKAETTATPVFAINDLSVLFTAALDIEDQDPEQAVFLYRRVIEIDPNYMQGKARDFVQNAEQRLKQVRLDKLLEQAQTAMKAGEWKRAEQVGHDILGLDEKNKEAKRITKISAKNAECEPLYDQAVAAAASGQWRAVATLMRKIKDAYPEYGDAKGVLTNTPIRSELAALLCNIATLREDKYGVRTITFSPDSKLLALGAIGTIRLREIPSGHEFFELQGWHDQVYSITFSPNGRFLAAGFDNGTIKLWKISNKQEIATFRGHKDCVCSVAFSPDGKFLASGSDDGTVKLWKIPGMQEVSTLRGHKDGVTSIIFSPDAKVLASGSKDKSIRLWEIPSGRTSAGFEMPVDSVCPLVFFSEKRLWVWGEQGLSIKLWEIPSKSELATLRGNTGILSTVTLSPNRKLLVSGSFSLDNTIKLWEMPNGRELVSLKGHTELVLSVAFSPDGKLIASGSEDKTIKLWGLG